MVQTSPNSIRSFLTWVWGGILILGGAFYLILTTGLIPYTIPMLPVVAAGVAVISLPFLGRWIVKRELWALLTAWIFVAVGLLLGVMYLFPGGAVFLVALALVEIAVPLVIAYFVQRQYWGLLVPAYIALALSVLLILIGLSLSPATLLGYAFLALSFPFNVVYWTNKERWWALIPGALFGVAAVIVLVFFSLLQPGTGPFYIVLNGTLAVVFLAAWLTARRLDWALWAAGGFAGAAVLSMWVPSVTNFAVLALAMGGYIVYRQLRGAPRVLPASTAPAASPASAAAKPSVPATGPAAPPASSSQAPSASPTVSGPPPGIEFVPLDPLKLRRPEDE